MRTLLSVNYRLLPLARYLFGMTLILAVIGCGVADPSLSQTSDPVGRILFAADGDIYEWDGDIRQVTHLGDAASPDWAPDGSRFALVRHGDAFSDLYVADATGTNLEQVTFHQPELQIGTQSYVYNSVWALDPDWSPDNDTVVFVSDRGTERNFLWLANVSQQSVTPATDSLAYGDNVEDPSFSPDGTRLVYTQRATSEDGLRRWTELWIADLQNGTASPLFTSEEGSYDAAWSPDGGWIAYVGREAGSNTLWAIPAAGGSPVVLGGKDVVSPAWSPDGQTIAYIEMSGSEAKVKYIPFDLDDDGQPKESKPQDLFKPSVIIDTPSGLSWAP